MNKDTIIGFVLIAIVLIGFSWWNQPSAEQIEAAKKQDSIETVMKEQAKKAQEEAALAAKQQATVADSSAVDTTALFRSALNGTSQQVVLKNDKLQLTLDTKGGVIRKAVIKNFNPSYKEMEIEWTDHCRQQEKGFSFENRYTSIYYKEVSGGTDKLSESGDNEESTEEATDWVAFRNQFFSVALIAKDNFAAGSQLTNKMDEKGSGYLKYFDARLKTAFDPTGKTPSEFEMYIGPNDFRLIKDVEEQSAFGKDLDLEQLVDLGWWLLRWINRWFTLYVFDWLTGFGFNMGIVLILITILLKVITFPMVKKSYMSSAKMRVLKPKFEEATKQYDKPEDQMKKQQEMMSLYSKYGVSPLSGCLPMLIQMPIWLAMFFFVPNAIQLRGESFLWMDDLSTYDPIVEWGTNIWGIGDHLSLTCILFCAAQLIYTWISMRQQKDQMVGAQAEQMKMCSSSSSTTIPAV